MSAISRHNEMVLAYQEQQATLAARAPGQDIWTGPMAARFRDDPHRPFDAVLESLAADLRPEDVLIDVGGGAGRLGLPLALRCREVVVVDPSEGMQQQFESVRVEAGINNARYVRADWLAADGINGDCALASHVTYFVPDIEAFVSKLAAAARRRVSILVNSEPPPNSMRGIFQLLHGVPQSVAPGYRELLPVLWEMGFLPDVRILPALPGGGRGIFPNREAAIESLVNSPIRIGAPPEQLRPIVEQHFEQLFLPRDGGWSLATTADSRSLLITWEQG